ncbi:MAG: tetratricopeptide repeat protein [Myxococcaceae bacterium]|nr:MAG: tetratricopeptide repeat protein [Myxococcaceae bacterium]
MSEDLFRAAMRAHKSYDFDQAITNFQKLVKDHPAAKEREDALFNAAALLEGQHRYAEAATAFQHCVELFPNGKNAPQNQRRVALLLEKQGDTKGEIKALEAFVRKFASKPEQAELVVDAKRRMGDAWAKRGNAKEAQRAYAAAADEFDRRRLDPEKQLLAAEAAAYSRFQLAEAVFQRFEALKITGSGKTLEMSFAKKQEATKSVNEAYAKVLTYKRQRWTQAVFYRRGYALERFGNTMLNAPVPPEVKRLGEGAEQNYRDQLAQEAIKLEGHAVQNYIATLTEARKHRVSNEWTRLTLEALNRFRPEQYPVLKEARGAFAKEVLYPSDLIATLTAPALRGQAAQYPPQLTEESAR